MKTYTLPVIGLMTLGASAFAAAAPSTGNSLPARDNFSACKWLGDRFKWFNSERDHKNPVTPLEPAPGPARERRKWPPPQTPWTPGHGSA